MSISLKDIAKAMNVSETTVSWVLSGQATKRRIGKQTQEKILQYAKSHNYTPNLLARSLHKGETGTIGLILPSMDDSFYSQVARKIEIEAEKYGYTLMICSSESVLERENRMIQIFKAKQVDGLIIAPTKYDSKQIEALIAENYPFVLFDRYFENLNTNYIIIDNEVCSHDLVESLIKEGRKKIAIILTNPHLKIMQSRLEGYKRALHENHIIFDQELVGIVPFADYSVKLEDMWKRMLSERPDIDAIFFATHVLAIDSFMYFHTQQVDIKNFGIACIHYVKGLQLLAPQMKIAKMPIEEIARNAVFMLNENILNRKNHEPFELKSKVINCEVV